MRNRLLLAFAGLAIVGLFADFATACGRRCQQPCCYSCVSSCAQSAQSAQNGLEEPKKLDLRKIPSESLPKPTAPPEKTTAFLVVELPADAQLFIDDKATTSTGTRRSYCTLPLAPLATGEAYYFELRAQTVRDGQTVSEARRVFLRPGQTVQTSFASLVETSVAAIQANQK